MVPPKTNFFPFLKPGLIMAQQTSIPVNYFMSGAGGKMTHLMPSYLKIAYLDERPGETPSALRCLS